MIPSLSDVLTPPWTASDFASHVWDELHMGPFGIHPTTEHIGAILEYFGVLEWNEEAARTFVREVRAAVLEFSERLAWQDADGWREPRRP